MKKSRKKFLLFGIFCLLGYFYFSTNATIDIQDIFEKIRGLGVWGIFLFILSYIFISGFIVPSIFFKVFAGAAFGVIGGAVIASFAAAISSLFKFLFARYFFQSSFKKKIETNARWKAVAHVIEKDGWKMLVLLRNVPVMNGMFLNYICGVTTMKPLYFVMASFVGRLPQIFILSYLGHLLGYTAGIENASGEHIMTEVILFVAGLAATVTAGYYSMRLYRKVMVQEKLIVEE